MGLLLLHVLRRGVPLLAIAAVVTFLFLGSFVWLGVTAYYVWSLLLVAALSFVGLRAFGDGDE